METSTSFVVLDSQQIENGSAVSQNPKDHEDSDSVSEATIENDNFGEIKDEDTGVPLYVDCMQSHSIYICIFV